MMKRLADVILSLAGLLVLSPVFLVVAVLVRRQFGSPVLFCQKRTGLHGRLFVMYKFRTMTTGCDAGGSLLPDAVRLTPFGAALRAWSLDELPSLFNVLRGDMSLVGPRPLLPEYLPLYTPWQARRHEVRPGLTGLAQIKGRNNLSWNEKFQYDVWYVDHRGPGLDLKILLSTMKVVFSRQGVNQKGSATAERFTATIEGKSGNEKQ